MKRSGQCLCGTVKVQATLTNTAIQACHCEQCQKWTGGSPLFVVHVKDVDVSGDAVGAYHASEWGERAFCKECGTTLYWRMQGKPPNSLAVGLLDDPSGLTVQEEIFVDRRAGWIAPWHDAGQSTEAQEFEKLAAYMKGAENA